MQTIQQFSYRLIKAARAVQQNNWDRKVEPGFMGRVRPELWETFRAESWPKMQSLVINGHLFSFLW